MATNNTPSAKTKADIDIENELWNAVNQLRGAVTAQQDVLSPGRYAGFKIKLDDGVRFNENMKLVTFELDVKFDKSALLEKRVRKNIDGIGFGLV